MRLAWFSPVPPVRSGIAACSAELVAALGEHEIDVYVDEPVARASAGRGARPPRSAHEFVWRHRRRPYDLAIYQLGNSSHHDYIWPYLFRFPGLAVLHDAHLHHARGASLLRMKRVADYRVEFAASQPELPADLAELAVAGFDSHLYYLAPMTRLVALASRAVAVHAPALAERIRQEAPGATVETIRLGHGVFVGEAEAPAMRRRARERYGISQEAVVFGVFGGLTPEKRVPQALDAFAALRPYHPSAHLLLAGEPARHYDVRADVARHDLGGSVTLAGYVEDEQALTDAIVGSDVALNLRWPTAREVSGPWLRALAAGTATVVMDLEHTWHVPSLDPRTWQANDDGTGAPAVTVAIDILDEDHSLRLAMRRLASDRSLRRSLADAGRRYWQREHSLERMAGDYRRLIPMAAAMPAPRAALPAHLVTDGDRTLRSLLDGMGLDTRIW